MAGFCDRDGILTLWGNAPSLPPAFGEPEARAPRPVAGLILVGLSLGGWVLIWRLMALLTGWLAGGR